MFENIEYFEAILHYGTLSKAAVALKISQPALTNYLKQLEAKAGATLFDRSTSPITLTEAGKVFYKYLKQSQSVKASYFTEIADLENTKSGSLTIGGASSTTAAYLSHVTSKFLTRYPDCKIKIRDGVVSDIARQALNGEIDFFIAPEIQRNTEFDCIPLLKERLFMCVPENFVKELSEKNESVATELSTKRIPLNALVDTSFSEKTYAPINANLFRDKRFILLEQGTNVREIIDHLLDNWQFQPESFIEVSQMMTGFHLCVNGAGISFLPESIIRLGRFKEYPVIYAVDETIAHRTMYACFKKSKYMSSLCSEFIDLLKETLNN